MPSPEENVIKAIRRSVKKIKLRHPIWEYRTHGSGRTKKGVPDLHYTFWGFSVWIEVKKPGSTATKLQWQRMKEIDMAGGFAACVDSRKDFEAFLGVVLYQLEGLAFCTECRTIVPNGNCCGRTNVRTIPGTLFERSEST